MRSQGLGWLLLGAVLVLFATGVTMLVNLGLDSGSAYPPFSSLRSDPQGSRALVDTYAAVGYEVRRNYLDYSKLSLPPGSTIFLLGATNGVFDRPAEIDALLDEVSLGARLVLACDAENWRNWELVPPPVGDAAEAEPATGDEDAAQDSEPADEPADADASTAPAPYPEFQTSSLLDRLGLRLEGADDGRANKLAERAKVAPAELPRQLPFRTEMRLVDESGKWTPLYEMRGRPVLSRRPWGRGEVLVVSESNLFSNEALRYRLQPDWLLWLAGKGGTLVFDETIHGAYESPGIGGLLRRYRLSGVFAGGLILALLFVWRNGTTLLPRSAAARREVVEGRSNESGFVSLLRRTLPRARLARIALEAWLQSPAFRSLPARRAAELRAQAEGIVTAADGAKPQPVHTFQRLCELIQTKDL